MDMVRIGVIGTNSISDTFMDAAKDVVGLEVQAVYSRTEEKGREFAKKYGIPLVYTSLDDFADSSEIDAVYIASPNSCHGSQAIRMVEGRKHVLCEKPFASNDREAAAMMQAAKDQGVLILEGIHSVFDPGYAKILELLSKVGSIRRAVFQYCQYSSRYDKFKQGIVMNAFNPEMSNAAVMDLGVYCVSPMVRLFGLPKEIYARSIFLENGMEGMGTVLASYDDMQVELEYSKINDSLIPSQIQGEAGTILIWRISDVKKIEVHLRNGEKEVYEIDKKENNMYYEIAEFVRLIEQKESAELHNQYTRQTMQVIDEIRHKAGILFQGK